MKKILLLLWSVTAFVLLSVATGSLYAENHVEQAQKMLLELGYNVGKVDGVFGPKTEFAIKELYTDHGQKYDGQLNDNVFFEITSKYSAILKARNKGKTISSYVQFDTGADAEELTFLGASDVDNDGIDDVIISGQVSDQNYDRGYSLQPVILLSNWGKFTSIPLPKSTQTTGVWAGSFVKVNETKYFYYGHNGERHVDPNSPTHTTHDPRNSMMIGFSYDGLPYIVDEAVAPTGSASVESFVDGESVFVVENNYDQFSLRPKKKNSSVLYRISDQGKLLIVAHSFGKPSVMAMRSLYEKEKPMNHIMPAFLNDNKFVDFIVATEKERIGEKFDKLVEGDPRSYVVLDPFAESTYAKGQKVYLDPADFQELHSGFNGNYFKSEVSGYSYVTMASSKNNLTWDRNKRKFVDFCLTVYKFHNSKLVSAFPIQTDLKNATMLKTYRIRTDKGEAVFFGRYRSSPFYIMEKDGVPERVYFGGINLSRGKGAGIIMPIIDRLNNCLRFISVPENPKSKNHTARISKCKFKI